MGLFDGPSSSAGHLNPGRHYSSRNRSSSRHRGVSPARSTRSAHTTTGAGNSHSHSRPGYARSASASFFGGGGGGGRYGNSRSIFSSGGSGSSYYKRRARDGYISYLIHKLQRMFKELWYYARRHPVKAFFALVVPLLSAGGAIHGLMRQVGVRLPFGWDGGLRRGGGGYYGSGGYGGSSRGGGGWMDQTSGLMQIARAFM